MLTELPLAEARQKLQAREISATELTQAYLDRIDAVDGEVKAYLHENTQMWQH